MKKMNKMEILTIGLMMFSIFFGAGNLIFPPALGQTAGMNLEPAMIGFILAGVGLPLLGIVATALQGGKYTEFVAKTIHPYFAVGLLSILYLTIGPLFAVPRTGAVSFEIGIRPFLGEDQMVIGQAIYTALFFIATYYLAMKPSKLVDRIGKLLTPALLIFLVVLFAKSFITPMGDILEAAGNYATAPLAQGFQDGYLTMDLLASVAIGTLVVNAIRMRGVENNAEIGKICIIAGVITVICMSMVYFSLAYLGATSAAVLGHSENGGRILADAARIFFGAGGNVLLALIIGFACLTTSSGMVSACSYFFNSTSKNRISYERMVLFCSLFGFAAANVGLTQLIKLSVPFLVAIYPIVIVLVVFSLFDPWIGNRKVIYRYAVAFAMVFAVIDGLNAADLKIAAIDSLFTAYIPFYSIMLGWLVPSCIGAVLGFGVSCFQKKDEEAELVHE